MSFFMHRPSSRTLGASAAKETKKMHTYLQGTTRVKCLDRANCGCACSCCDTRHFPSSGSSTLGFCPFRAQVAVKFALPCWQRIHGCQGQPVNQWRNFPFRSETMSSKVGREDGIFPVVQPRSHSLAKLSKVASKVKVRIRSCRPCYQSYSS